MKKMILASVTVLLFSLSAMSQTTNPPVAETKEGMKELRKDIRDVRKDKAERRKEIKEGDKSAVKDLTNDIKTGKKEIRHDAKDLRKDGVKHPVRRAGKQLHRAHARKNG